MNNNRSNNKFVAFFNNDLALIFITHFLSVKDAYNGDFNYYVGTDKKTINQYKSFFLDNNIKFVDVESALDNYSNISIKSRHTLYTYLRFDIFNIFNELNNQKVIYIDVDTIVNNKIEAENQTDNFAISDRKYNWYIKNKAKKHWKNRIPSSLFAKIVKLIDKGIYFNAGVLIINNPNKYIELCNIIKSSNIRSDDQTLLNYFNDDHIIVDKNQKNNNKGISISRKDSVNHFIGKWKPWNKLNKMDLVNKFKYSKTNFSKYYNAASQLSKQLDNDL